jgi:putative two-component system response regulator
MQTIYVVDDILSNLQAAQDVLGEQYRVMKLPSAAKMFALIDKVAPDLILLDIEMPEIDGFEALRKLKTNPKQANIPVIFLTSMTDSEVEARGFELGVVDFITKPFSAPVLKNRIKTHLSIDEIIKERTEKLERMKNSIVFVLADMVENRDKSTGGHIERTTSFIRILLNSMLEQGLYVDEICDIDFELFTASARLHDVGKIAISDVVLNKPGKLNDEEFIVMKSHTIEGERIIAQIVSRNKDNEEFLQNASLFAGYHHERWDGKGYPYGLSGKSIPIQGRIMAFADVYDALVSVRPYKKLFTHEEAVKIIMDGAGTQFDPEIADIFSIVSDSYKRVYVS